MKRNIGFTLTEVLLAIAIVGIIAALVMPIIISNYTNDSLDKAYQKELNTINNSLTTDSLVYFDTNYGSTDNMEKFMKKYFKVSKYCGMDNGDCFASKYYQYVNKDKVEYEPTYKGACASLKNGMSLCLTPTKGLIDVNGKKGPNLKDKDLREFTVAFDSYTRQISKTSSIVYRDEVNIKIPEAKTECGEDSETEECCLGRSSLDNVACCKWASVKAKFSSLCNVTTCSSDSSTWDQTCCSKNASSITIGHHCCSYRAYDDTIYSKCCRTTGYFTVTIRCSDGKCTPSLSANAITDRVIGSVVPTATVKSKLKINIGSTGCYFGSACTPPTNTNTTYSISVSPLGGYNYRYGSITPTVGSGYTSGSVTLQPQCDWVLSD